MAKNKYKNPTNFSNKFRNRSLYRNLTAPICPKMATIHTTKGDRINGHWGPNFLKKTHMDHMTKMVTCRQ